MSFYILMQMLNSIQVFLSEKFPRSNSDFIAIFVNTLRPRLDRHHFVFVIFKCMFSNKYILILNKMSLKYIPKGPIKDNPALFQMMAWHRPGDKPLFEPMMNILLTFICITQPQWVKADMGPCCLLGTWELIALHYGQWSLMSMMIIN